MLLALALIVAVVAALRGAWSPCGLSMLTQLNPVAERSRGHRFAITAIWYVAGALLGGAVFAAVAAAGARVVAFAGPARAVTFALVGAAALVTLASDLPLVRWSLPLHPRQVNEQWLGKYRRWIYAGGFGVQIGTGFATYIMTSAVYLTVALAVLMADPWQATLVCLVFAGVRGLTILAAGAATTPERLRTIMRRVDALEPTSRHVCLAVEALALLTAAVVLGLGAALTILVLLAGGAAVASSRSRRATVKT